MEDVSVKIKKRGPKVDFKLVKSVTLVKMIKTINEKKLSLEEAEEIAHIKPAPCNISLKLTTCLQPWTPLNSGRLSATEMS